MKKLLIIGESGVGKSSYVNRLKNRNIKDTHVPTSGLETTNISYKSINFTIWDTSGTEKFSGLKEGYYIGSDCAIIMISDTELSYNTVGNFKNMVLRKCGNIPIVFIVNKCEINNIVLTTIIYNKKKIT